MSIQRPNPARGKTTPASNEGSFKTHAHGAPEVDLAAEAREAKPVAAKTLRRGQVFVSEGGSVLRVTTEPRQYGTGAYGRRVLFGTEYADSGEPGDEFELFADTPVHLVFPSAPTA